MDGFSKHTVVGGLLVFICAFNAGAVGLLEPGNTLVLRGASVSTPPDGTDASCIIFPIISLTATCGTDQGGQQFGVRTTARGLFDRGQGSALQFYDLEVGPGDGSETPLLAQISGKANFNGFLAVVGGGQVEADLKLKVIDLGPTGAPYTDGGKVVHRETLASHQIKGATLTGPSFSITIEGGAPYIGVGASPELGLQVSLQKELVRDKIDFGMHVLLLRGHTYRLQFETGAMAKKAVAPGLSIAQFKLGDDRLPDLIDPQNWLDGINDLLDTGLPSIKPEAINILQEDKGIFSLFSDKRRLSGAPDFSTAKGILQHIAANNPDMPTSFREIIEKRLKRSSLLEEGIANPGVEVRELQLTLQTDQVEILRHHTELLNHISELLITPQGQRPGFPLKQSGGGSPTGSTAAGSQATPVAAQPAPAPAPARSSSRRRSWGDLFR
jgi:hypothetical protein